jgi:hypothetical protein
MGGATQAVEEEYGGFGDLEAQSPAKPQAAAAAAPTRKQKQKSVSKTSTEEEQFGGFDETPPPPPPKKTTAASEDTFDGFQDDDASGGGAGDDGLLVQVLDELQLSAHLNGLKAQGIVTAKQYIDAERKTKSAAGIKLGLISKIEKLLIKKAPHLKPVEKFDGFGGEMV